VHASGEPAGLALLAACEADHAVAAELAGRLGLPLLPAGASPELCDAAAAVLLVDGRRRCLQRTGRGAPGPVAADFASASMRYRRTSGTPELLARAVGQGRKSPLRIVDATAGLGRDAFVLASLGCDLLMCEREPVVAELLRSGLEIALHDDDGRLADIARRMCLWPGDARQLDAGRLDGVDVICLDPMFPPRGKTAAVKKEMRLFHDLLKSPEDPQDAEALLTWALAQDVARVVVKRPARSPPLAQRQPSHDIRGKSVRYDVYVHRAITGTNHGHT